MPKSITPGQIKKTNRQLIYRYIYDNPKSSQQDISYALHLSRPTVTVNLSALEEDGLICRSGQIESDQIGRKAIAYSVVADYRVAVGVEFLRAMVKLIAVDLYGRKLRRVVLERRFENQPSYYESICGDINAFIESLDIPRERVLGVGISLQGIASADGRVIVYGAILGCTGMTVDVFERRLNLPCLFIHDPAGAALSELWASPELTDAIYMSLSPHLGGAFISNRHILTGKHGHSATFEHMQAEPDGELCYCGRRGCWDTLLSLGALLGDETRDGFFARVRAGDPDASRRWRDYLARLARLIGALHLVNDVDFILGGHLAQHFTEDDLRLLYQSIRESCPFEEADDFIHISKMPSHNITIGVSLPYILTFLDDIDA